MDEQTRQRLSDGEACLQAGLQYLSLGWSVLSLCPPDHVGVGRSHVSDCSSPGKSPWHTWKQFQDRLPSEQEVRAWWKALPNSNVGVALGPVSNLIRVDVEGVAGEARLQSLSGGAVPETLEFRSGRSDGTGRGLLYSIPPGVVLRTTVLREGEEKSELRFQAKGAQTALPPSRHKDGGVYSWKAGHRPGEIEIAVAPGWLVKELLSQNRPKSENASSPVNGNIPEGRRNDTLTSLGGKMRQWGMGTEEILASLREVNLRRCDPPLQDHELEVISHSVGGYDGGWGFNPPNLVAPGGAQSQEEKGLVLTAMNQIKAQPLEWLVPHYLPLGKLCLLAGDGGNGKSVITLHVAARVSRGLLPFSSVMLPSGEPAEVLLVNCEDDFEDTVLPRLMSCGADLEKIFRVDGVRSPLDGKTVPFGLAHCESVESELERHPEVRLVIIDPCSAYVGITDDHRDAELRGLLGPLSEMAARRKITVLLVKHLSKNSAARAALLVGGSVAWVNACRATFVVAADGENDRKLMMPVKWNLGPPPPSLAYTMEPIPETEKGTILEKCSHLDGNDRSRLGEQLFRIRWEGPVDVDADQVIASSRKSERADKSGGRVDEAADWLLDYLADGPKPSDELIKDAKREHDYSRNTMFRAKATLKDRVRARKDSFNGGWVWELYREESVSSAPSDGCDPCDSCNGSQTPWNDEESQG